MMLALIAYSIFAICLLVSIVVDQKNWVWFQAAALAFVTFLVVI